MQIIKIIRDILDDLYAVESNKFKAFLSNRGFHALLIYRISNLLYRWHIPLLPMILTRIVQIIYSIDIDWRAKIAGGVVIVHGVGVVIGQGAEIGAGTKLYHGVTLGISHSNNDGFPKIGRDVLVGAGAKILGKVNVGDNAKIGANAVVLSDVPPNAIAVGVPAKIKNL
ncbi:serine O-acetyltransferase EpsC [Anoxybacillus flavithermus]|uniref:serine O-acetyltransferase EpsC n=1 Tax=Anoxybacillus flavithermus TaxID=33934 RepID=UPI0019D69F01